MSNLVRLFATLLVLQFIPHAIADDIDLDANLTGVWSGLDESRCYVRQYEKNRQQAVSIFCENPEDQSSYVFTGIRTDSGTNRVLDGTITFVPKGSRIFRSSARFGIGTIAIRGKTPNDITTKKALRPTLTSGSRAITMPFIRPLTFPIEPDDQEMITRSSFGVWSDQSPAPGGSEDLTGIWYGNDGGIYYVTQRGPFISWFGEHPDGGWSNVAEGARIETRLALSWADVPKGRTRGSGQLGLRLDGPNRLVRTSRSGGFGGSEWIRNSDERWVQPDPIGRTDDHRRLQLLGTLCPFDETRSSSEGDREFGGNGPRITARIDLSIEPRMRRSVRATVNFTATETGGDNSTVSGSWTKTIYIAPENRTIAEILSDTSTSFNFVSAHSAGLEVGMSRDTIGPDRYGIWSFEPIGMQAQPASEAVSRLFYVGDTGGSDISSDNNCTRETRLQFIEFNPMRIRLD